MADYKTIEGLKLHPLWNQLSEKQQNFIIAYIDTKGKRKESAMRAFKCRSDKSAEAYARKLLSHWLVRKMLAAYYGQDVSGTRINKDEFENLIAERIRSAQCAGRDFTYLAQLLAEMNEWIAPPKKGPKTKDKPQQPQPEETTIPPSSVEEDDDAVDNDIDINDLVRQIEERQRRR